MEYSTNDLSKILDMSTNTIRRYDARGYLDAQRDEENGYRIFNHSDVEKLMYVAKYRKVGFTHEDITEILQSDIGQSLRYFEQRKQEMDELLAHYKALSHLLKDDIQLMKRIEEYGSDWIEGDCSPLHYVLYQYKGKLCVEGEQGEALHRFMSTCPEFEYIYCFDKEDLEAHRLCYSEGVAANQLFTTKYGVDVSSPVKAYEKRPCILRFLRLPLDLLDRSFWTEEMLWKTLYDEIREYMQTKGCFLDGDVFGIKLGFSREQERDWQYVLMHYPIATGSQENIEI